MGQVRILTRWIGLLVAATASVGIALTASSFAGAQQAPTQGTIIVEKQLIPDGYTPPQGGFVFRGAIQATLGDGQSASATVDPGTYTVTESLEGRPFWDLISLQCTEDGETNSSGDIPSLTATYKVEAGETARCVFTNQKRSIIIVKKQTIPASAQQSFSFTASYDQDGFSLSDGQQNSSPELLPGSYSVSESVPAGWKQQSATCGNGDTPDSITLPAATTLTCTFVNVKLGTLAPTVLTTVHDAQHNVITSAPVGTSVHDRAVVSGSGATPTGTVTFTVHLGSLTCAGAGSAAGTVTLDAAGVAHPSSSVTVPAGGLSFSSHYSGDSVYAAGDGPCESLSATPVTTGKGAIDVQKSANPTSLKEPGGPVTFSVTITNTSSVNVSVTNVVDDKFGDLDDDGGSKCFDVPINLAPGAHSSCQFIRQVTGSGGTEHVNTVTASGTDQFGNPVSDTGSAKVVITPRLIDLVVVKNATSPTPLNGTVRYSLSVTNKGPDTATNVQLADPAPAGITYLTATPSQGTCNVAPAMVTCDLGTINAGQSVTVAVTAKAVSVGSHTNTATVTGSGGRETNTADNTDSAVTVVPAPLKPPTVNPKPKPLPEYCLALTVKPGMITADGRPDTVTVRVMAGPKPAKGARVAVVGVGVKKSGRANAKGVAVIKVNPKKAGIVTITVAEGNREMCGAKRIGVVGVFLPPVTG